MHMSNKIDFKSRTLLSTLRKTHMPSAIASKFTLYSARIKKHTCQAKLTTHVLYLTRTKRTYQVRLNTSIAFYWARTQNIHVE